MVVAFLLVFEMDTAAIAAIGWVNLQSVCMRDEHPTCLMGGYLEQGFVRYSEGPTGTRGLRLIVVGINSQSACSHSSCSSRLVCYSSATCQHRAADTGMICTL